MIGNRIQRRIAKVGIWLATTVFATVGGCLPDNYIQNLVGSSLSQLVGAAISDVVNTLFPPV